MSLKPKNIKYVVISPAKDEEHYINDTIDSIVNQTIKPLKWIIVDDGSQDQTPEIIRKYGEQYEWIELVTKKRDSSRQPGSAVIRAFNHGYELVKNMEFDFVVKLDCDLRFDIDYFEKLLGRFSKEKKLGIASGIYLEENGNKWVPVKMPQYHAAGASKIIRKECFEQIGGFVPAKGWDTLDEIRAGMLGWETLHFPDIEFYHLKNEGIGIGFTNTNAMHGEIFYVTGGSRFFFVLKCLHRMLSGKPFMIGGLFMLGGYLSAYLKRKEKLVNEDEERFYKKQLNKRLLRAVSNFLRKNGE